MRFAPLALFALAASGAAQTTERLIAVGDPVAGAGDVTEILGTQVVGFGWYAQVLTTDPVASEVIVEYGSKALGLGDVPNFASGSPIVEIIDASHEDIFSSNYLLRLASTPADDEVFTCWTNLVLREGDLSAPMTPNFPQGTTWGSFHNVTDAPYTGAYLLCGDANDPTWTQGPRTYLAIGGYGGSVCAPFQLNVFASEGQPLPGTATIVLELFTDEGSIRTDRSAGFPGSWWSIFACRILAATGPRSAVVLHEAVGDVSTLVAVEGQPSPVPGRNWGDLQSARVEVGKQSSVWALRGNLDSIDPSTDELIVRNGVKFVQEGDVLDATSPYALSDLADAPPVIEENGRMLWGGTWLDAVSGASIEGLFLDRDLLVETGVTQVEGATVIDLELETEGFHIEPFGQFASFIATLDSGVTGVFRIALNSVETYCSGTTSSAGCKPEVSWTGPWASASGAVPFALRADGVASNVTGLLLYSLAGADDTPIGGAKLCLAKPITRRILGHSGGSLPPGAACDGAFKDDFGAWIQSGNDPGLVPGARVHAQFWVRDPASVPPGAFDGSEAVRFQVQP